MIPITHFLILYAGTFHELVGNFQVFINPIHLDLLVTVVMVFNLFLFLIWAADKICLSYRNMRRGKKKEKFTLLGRYSLRVVSPTQPDRGCEETNSR